MDIGTAARRLISACQKFGCAGAGVFACPRESRFTSTKRRFTLRTEHTGLTTPGESYAIENARVEIHFPRIGSSHVLRRESVIRAAERRIRF